MKIAFTGASSTGKTTVAKLLSEELEIPFVGSTARELAKKYNYQPEQFKNRKTLINFQKEVINIKYQTELKYTTFVTDRAYIDSITYLLKLYYLLDPIKDKEFTSNYIDHCLSLTDNNYTIVIRFPQVLEVKEDEIRKTDTIANMVVDILNKGVFSSLKHVERVELPKNIFRAGDPQVVVDYILQLPIFQLFK